MNRTNLELKQLFPFFDDYLTLKKIRRTGWQLRGIKEAESIADHCYGVVLLTMILSPICGKQVDSDKALRMAVIHELGECRIGDIAYTALKYFPDKSQKEQEAVKDVTSVLDGQTAQQINDLFAEFEKGETIEARLVRAVDKLEMLITAFEYEKTGFAALTDFWQNVSTFSLFNDFPTLADFAFHLKTNRKFNDSNCRFNQKI